MVGNGKSEKLCTLKRGACSEQKKNVTLSWSCNRRKNHDRFMTAYMVRRKNLPGKDLGRKRIPPRLDRSLTESLTARLRGDSPRVKPVFGGVPSQRRGGPTGDESPPTKRRAGRTPQVRQVSRRPDSPSPTVGLPPRNVVPLVAGRRV